MLAQPFLDYLLDLVMGGGGGGAPRGKLADPDEATYWGRVRKTFHQLDFRTALTTDHALQDALALVAARGARITRGALAASLSALTLLRVCAGVCGCLRCGRGWDDCGRGRV